MLKVLLKVSLLLLVALVMGTALWAEDPACRLADRCPWDLNADGDVGQADIDLVLACWGTVQSDLCATADFDDDGSVGGADLTAVLTNFGACPPPCPADFNGDDQVDGFDRDYVLACWLSPLDGICKEADLNGDGSVDSADLSLLLAAWGPCPPPPAP